jgi:hypothetical protein
MSWDAKSPESEAAAILAARHHKMFLERIEPHIRRLVLAVDAESVDIFDSSFHVGAATAAAKLRRKSSPLGRRAQDTDFQEFGVRELAITSAVSLLINIVAAVAVGHVQVRHPGWWSIVTGDTTEPITALEYIKNHIARSGLPKNTQKALMDFVVSDPVLHDVLKNAKIRVGQ